MNRRPTTLLLVSSALVFLGAAEASGQTYPTRPVRLVVGFSAGGPTDVIARVVAQNMAAELGQPAVVENKTGANALIATEAVAREAPDGHTLMVSTLSHSVNAVLLPQARYDPLRDFSPVGHGQQRPGTRHLRRCCTPRPAETEQRRPLRVVQPAQRIRLPP